MTDWFALPHGEFHRQVVALRERVLAATDCALSAHGIIVVLDHPNP